MDRLNILGWEKHSSRKYVHYCGAVITKRGKLWNATTAGGTHVAGHTTELEAAAYLAKHDPSFWTHGSTSMGCNYNRVCFESGSLEDNRENDLFVFYSSDEKYFTQHIMRAIKNHSAGKAACARCSRLMADFNFRRLYVLTGHKKESRIYLACICGHPVWRLAFKMQFSLHVAIKQSIRQSERREKIKIAGGMHRSQEIAQILSIQENRCIYCNVLFTNEVRPTKDHLLPVVMGGADWALNIVMACRSCNSRRGDIPFRTYCKLLSPTQNRRILMCLHRRLIALDSNAIDAEAFESFCLGLEYHDSRHLRYRDIQGISPLARRNAAMNKLLPRAPILILKKARLNTGTLR